MANVITLIRLLLIIPLVALIYWGTPAWQLLTAPLLLLVIALDGLDGYVARRRKETTVFGSIFDIAADRVIEYVLWAVLGQVGLVPMWVALIFIVRGTLVDSIRYAAISDGETAFGMMRSRIGRFLVAGHFMRGFYGVVKAVAFALVLVSQPLPELAPAWWQGWGEAMRFAALGLVYASVALCLLRGFPVLIEFAVQHKVFKPHQATR